MAGQRLSNQLTAHIFSLQQETAASVNCSATQLSADFIDYFMKQLLCYVMNHFLRHLSQTLHGHSNKYISPLSPLYRVPTQNPHFLKNVLIFLRQPLLTCSTGYGPQVQCTHTSTQDDLFDILANELLPSN